MGRIKKLETAHNTRSDSGPAGGGKVQYAAMRSTGARVELWTAFRPVLARIAGHHVSYRGCHQTQGADKAPSAGDLSRGHACSGRAEQAARIFGQARGLRTPRVR